MTSQLIEASKAQENGKGMYIFKNAKFLFLTYMVFWGWCGHSCNTERSRAHWKPWKTTNHDKSNVSELLAVPRYADLVEEDAETSEEEPGHGKTQPGVVKSREGWWKEMKKWVEEERDQSDDDGELADIAYGHQWSKWLPQSLDLLFAGRKVTDIDEQLRKAWRRQAYTQEAQLMELLADEEADEERMPDDGELEGSGDDYEG